jgi:hypothetical protein
MLQLLAVGAVVILGVLIAAAIFLAGGESMERRR